MSKTAKNPAAKAKPVSLEILTPVEIALPPAVLKWATEHANDMGWTVSDLVRGLIELEQHREDKIWTTHAPERSAA